MALRNPPPPSPSSTLFSPTSSLSAYRATSGPAPDYRSQPSQPPPQPQGMMPSFRAFYDQLRAFLLADDIRETPGTRADPRSKLVKLSEAQFMELSTDVNDECLRRGAVNPTPFLPVRSELHPKRNQARQKLATLSKSKFRDLASDIFFELGRRFPQFRDGLTTPPDDANSSANTSSIASASASALTSYSQNPSDLSQQPPQQQGPQTYRLESPYNARPISPAAQPQSQGLRRSEYDDQDSSSSQIRRRPSEDSTRFGGGRSGRPSLDEQRGVWRRPSQQQQPPPPQPQQQQQQQQQEVPFSPPPTSTATLGHIAPNKSTIAEEEIEVPYGRDESEGRASSAGPGGGGPGGLSGLELGALGGGFDAGVLMREEDDSEEEEGSREDGDGDGRHMGRRRVVDEEEDERDDTSRGVSEFYDKLSFGRASVASSAAPRFSHPAQNGSAEMEKLRREYEFRILTLEGRVQGLEGDVSEAAERKDEALRELDSVRNELAQVKSLTAQQNSLVSQLRQELAQARDEKEDAEREVERVRERLNEVAAEAEEGRRRGEREGRGRDEESEAVIDALRGEVQRLMAELGELSERNDEMMGERDTDAGIIRDLGSQVKEWRRKYESAKTELRHIKATSVLAVPMSPKRDGGDDHLPTSEGGAIADANVTAFQSSIDDLLAAGRSSQPTSVLAAMKAVITSVSSINNDVRSFEQRPRKDKMGVDDALVRSLKDNIAQTLNNLVMASKNHGTSYGLSPVSLLDAAASHVSASVIEVVKLLKIRKTSPTTRSFLERAPSSTTPSKSYVAGPLRSVSEQSTPERSGVRASSSASRDATGSGADRNSGPSPIRISRRKSNISGDSHNGLPTPDRSTPTERSPPMYQMQGSGGGGGRGGDVQVPSEGSDAAWAELKPYLEAQSEPIVYCIQNVLSGIRAGVRVGELNDDLTQIITIVSSIVAVCKDSLPTASARQGQELLRELSEHCNTLSEAQVNSGEADKQMRQAMATASVGIARAMKELMKF